MIKHRYDTARVSLLGDRRINQDRCTILDNDENLLMVLGDGMGGHPRGEVAAQILIDTAEQQLYLAHSPILSPGSFLTRVLHKAHENIMAFGYDQTPPIDPRTTAVICLIQDGTAYWAHAGDSRLYLIRDNRIAFCTTDDSYVERLRQQGMISDTEKENHPQRNYVTRCLGGAIISPEISLGRQEIHPGDKIILCTDGLWGSVGDQVILDLMGNPEMELDDAALTLAETAAQKAYPESDNVTLLAVEIGPVFETATSEPTRHTPAEQKEDELNNAIAELQNAIENFNSEYKEDK